MFHRFKLDQSDLFQTLRNANDWEEFSGGREGDILVDLDQRGGLIPIIRTTTVYNKPSQPFATVHYALIDKIKNEVKSMTDKSQVEFNNAMVEVYDSRYTKMRFHSDQALDIADDSYICIFSCYEDGNDEPRPRKLITKDKVTGNTAEYLMDNNSVVLFSRATNEKFVHKIVADGKAPKSRWLGVTLRLSKTFIRYDADGNMFMCSPDHVNTKLTLATDKERHEFFTHKSLENAQVGYCYPDISYTLSRH